MSRYTELTIDWLNYALEAELEPDKAIRDTDYCIQVAQEFATQIDVPTIYYVRRATNLPRDSKYKYFVTCNKRDMQPYVCDSICAYDLEDAYQIIQSDAEKYGELNYTIA